MAWEFHFPGVFFHANAVFFLATLCKLTTLCEMMWRRYHVGHNAASTPQTEPVAPDSHGLVDGHAPGWTEPCPRNSSGVAVCRDHFSGDCWLFARDLFLAQEPRVPLGVVEAAFGGTGVVLWSPPEALVTCGVTANETYHPANPNNLSNSDLWHGMITPLLNTTIAGIVQPSTNCNNVQFRCFKMVPNNLGLRCVFHPAPLGALVEKHVSNPEQTGLPQCSLCLGFQVWHQGDADSGPTTTKPHCDGPLMYNCSFPALIAGWRSAWSQGTHGRTPKTLPFGFCQLDANMQPSAYSGQSTTHHDITPLFQNGANTS